MCWPEIHGDRCLWSRCTPDWGLGDGEREGERDFTCCIHSAASIWRVRKHLICQHQSLWLTHTHTHPFCCFILGTISYNLLTIILIWNIYIQGLFKVGCLQYIISQPTMTYTDTHTHLSTVIFLALCRLALSFPGSSHHVLHLRWQLPLSPKPGWAANGSYPVERTLNSTISRFN